MNENCISSSTDGAYKIAIGDRLRKCPSVKTLGLRPNFSDYTDEEKALIHRAEKIYYPTIFYADLFEIMGKPTFPSAHTYRFIQDKIKQTALFDVLKIPHPRTRVFYGKRQQLEITKYFSFPFIAKTPRTSDMGKGVFLIRNKKELEEYLSCNHAAYIQEYIPVSRDLRIVIIGYKPVIAFWRIAQEGEYRCNLAKGGGICFDDIPRKALELAVFTAKACKWDDTGIDIIFDGERFCVIEANMRYGRKGFRHAGIEYAAMMEMMIQNGEI